MLTLRGRLARLEAKLAGPHGDPAPIADMSRDELLEVIDNLIRERDALRRDVAQLEADLGSCDASLMDR